MDCPPIDQFQPDLYEAIKNGNLEKIKSVLSSSRANKDLDLLDSSGKTIIQVAADLNDASDRDDVITLLLSCGASLQLALLNTVHQGDVRVVEILLQFCDQQPQTTSPKMLSVRGNTSFTTPLSLAARLQNFQIVKLFLEHGFTIEDPKTMRMSTEFTDVSSEKLHSTVHRLNEYRALASPVFIAASFLQNVRSGPDPVLRACALSKEFRDISEQEYEFREKYLGLCNDCEEFTVSLLKECCTLEEIRCVLEAKSEGKTFSTLETDSLNILEFAALAKTKKFVAHPYSLLVLNSEVYKNASFLEVKGVWKKSLLLLVASLLCPLALVVWFVFEGLFPKHKVTSMFRSPFVRFLIYAGSYQTFLYLLAITSSTSHFLGGFSFSDLYVRIFVIGLLVDLIKDVLQYGRSRFFSYHWNYLASTTVVSFVLGDVIWLIGRVTLPSVSQSLTLEDHAVLRSYKIMLSAESFLSLGILQAFALNLSFLSQENASIGPLLNAFIQMLIDAAKFFLYFGFVFLAFAVSFTKLYSQYNAANEYYSPGTEEKISLELERLDSSANVIFWSLFGQVEREGFLIAEASYKTIWWTGLTLFGVFNIVAVLVAVNMLIAILNESYTRISENLDTEWKFTRTKMWLNWIYKKSVLPPPFSILYVLLPVGWIIERLFKAFCPEPILVSLKKLIKRRPKTRTISRVKGIGEQKRRKVLRQLVLRYLARRSYHLDTEIEPTDSEEENNNEATAATAEQTMETNQSNQK